MNKEYFLIQPARFKLDGGAMFGIIPKPLWERKAPADELNRIELALRLWLIKTADRVVLVDTGIGDYHGEKFEDMFAIRGKKNPLVQALASISLKPSDITDLVLSHLHFDHVGGLVSKEDSGYQLVLPSATIHLHQDHYQYSLAPTDRDSGSFHSNVYKDVLEAHAAQGKIHWLKGKSGEIIPELGLNFETSDGHTPWLIHPYDEKYIYLTDLVPTSAHVSVPWVMGYDITPGITTEDKKRMLDFVLKQELSVIYEHDSHFWGGNISLTEKGFRPKECYNAEQALAYSIPS